MKVKATHRNARLSARKVRPLARLLRGLSVADAEMQLRYLPGRNLRDTVLAVLNSALANAKHNHGLEAGALSIAEIVIDDGFSFKRFRPASRGSAYPILKRTAHITVTLEPRDLPSGQASLHGKGAAITTISADQYAAEALDDDHVISSPTGAGKAGQVVTKDVPMSKERETYGKMRTLQGGGDKKKSFRRKSIG